MRRESSRTRSTWSSSTENWEYGRIDAVDAEKLHRVFFSTTIRFAGGRSNKLQFAVLVNFYAVRGIYQFVPYTPSTPKTMRLFSILTLFLALAISAFGQSTAFTKTDLTPAETDKIIKKFTANERLFRSALNVYAFNRNAQISTIGMGGQITGTYRRESFMTFDGDGKRVEKILFFPISTLTEIEVTQADIENLGGLDPFAIEPKYIDQYKFTYLGKEKIDELNLFVFDVAPKVVPKAEKNGLRLFQGRIWVDDQDLLIVKSKGKAVPEWKDERFAVIETWRENVGGKYWFPTYSSSDDELVFRNGQAVKIKIRVRYTDYRLGRTDIRVIDEEEDVVEPKLAPTPPGLKKP